MIYSNTIVNSIHDWVQHALHEKKGLTVKFIDVVDKEKLTVEVYPTSETVLITRETL